MAIKFADEIIKDIEKRGSVKIPNGNLTGEEFEKWLKNNYRRAEGCCDDIG